MSSKIPSHCALCLRATQECGALQDSHIVPRSLQKRTKREGKNLRAVTPIDKFSWNVRDLKEHLLCYDCEKRINAYETPALRALESAKISLCIQTADIGAVEGLIRSVFWRASVAVSTKPGYSLSSEHELKLRQHFASGTELEPLHFLTRVCVLGIAKLIPKNSSGFVAGPWRGPGVDGVVSCFVVAGMLFCMYERPGAGSRSRLEAGRPFRIGYPTADEQMVVDALIAQFRKARTPKNF